MAMYPHDMLRFLQFIQSIPKLTECDLYPEPNFECEHDVTLGNWMIVFVQDFKNSGL